MTDPYAPYGSSVGPSRGRSRDRGRGRTWPWALLAALCFAGLIGCITLLYLGGQWVMAQGGFVASGGPYEIAHPAPGWVILMPASIWVGLILGAVHFWLSRRAGGFNVVGIAWVALFGLLGLGFFQAGLNPPGGGTAWAWILCGVVFWAMALPVALGVIGGFLPTQPRYLERFGPPTPSGGTLYVVAHALAVPAGVALALGAWSAVTGL